MTHPLHTAMTNEQVLNVGFVPSVIHYNSIYTLSMEEKVHPPPNESYSPVFKWELINASTSTWCFTTVPSQLYRQLLKLASKIYKLIHCSQ